MLKSAVMSFLRNFDRLWWLFNSPTPDHPKKIYSLWLQGVENAPEIVRLNFHRWAKLNPEYKLVVLDQAQALDVLSDFPIDPAALSHQALSDVLRIHLLAENGGIWVDASLFPVKPLSDWLPETLTNTGVFLFNRPAEDRLIASWFIVAPENSGLIARWAKKTRQYWSRELPLSKKVLDIPDQPVRAVRSNQRDRDPNKGYFYFWFHYLFADSCASDIRSAMEWRLSATSPALPPHALQHFCARPESFSLEALRQSAGCAPVQKLNWRNDYPIDLLAQI